MIPIKIACNVQVDDISLDQNPIIWNAMTNYFIDGRATPAIIIMLQQDDDDDDKVRFVTRSFSHFGANHFWCQPPTTTT